MLLSSMAEAMYWCGRYVERACAVSRAVSSFERLGMDLPGARPLDLKPLAGLLDDGSSKAPTTRAGQLQSLVFDEHTPSSVLGALGAARENLRGARVVAPAELWHVLNQVHARVTAARGRSETAILEALEDVLAAGERFDGERAAHMLRDPAYAFLTMGIAIERADMLLRTLTALLPVLHPDGWERAFDDVRWRGLLDALGVTSMYRRRHHLSCDLTRLLALVVVDGSCPRSLAFCIATVEQQLALLPHAGRCRSALSLVQRDGAALGHAGTGRSKLEFSAALASLARLHEQLQACYFPGGSPGAPAESEPVSGVARDPFAHLEREHARTEALLVVLEELAGRVERGDDVERQDLRALFELLIGHGELGHHEKEESILAPELVASGFDWYEGPLAAMRREHRQEQYLLRALARHVDMPGVWPREVCGGFVSLTQELCRFLRSHMDHERRDLFVQASRSLSPERQGRLLTAFETFDVDHGNARGEQALVGELSRKYGVDVAARAGAA